MSSARIDEKVLENKNLYFTIVPCTIRIAAGDKYNPLALFELMHFLSYFGTVEDVGAFLISEGARFTWGL